MGVIKPIDGLIGANFYEPTTTKEFDLGIMAAGPSGAMFCYAQAGAAIAAHNYVVLPNTYIAALVTAANSITSPVHAVAPVAFDLDEYGWFQVAGFGSDLTVTVAANTLAGPDATNIVQTTATAGVITSLAALVGGQVALRGIQVAASVPAAAVACRLLNPRLGVF